MQADMARAEALVRAARVRLFTTVNDVWQTLLRGEEASLQQRALLRTAATHTVYDAAQAVDLMYNAGGATSTYTSSPLERCRRDIHVMAQHYWLSAPVLEQAGRALLGLPPGTPAL